MILKGLGIYPAFSRKEIELLNTLQTGDEWKQNKELEALLDDVFEGLNSFGLNKEYVDKFEQECIAFCGTDLSDYMDYGQYLSSLDCMFYDEIIITKDNWRDESPSNLARLSGLPTIIDRWYNWEVSLLNREVVEFLKLTHDNAFVIKKYPELTGMLSSIGVFMCDTISNVDLAQFRSHVVEFKNLLSVCNELHKLSIQPDEDAFSRTRFEEDGVVVLRNGRELASESQIIPYFSKAAVLHKLASNKNFDIIRAIAHIKEESFLVTLSRTETHNELQPLITYRKLEATDLSSQKHVSLSLDVTPERYCKLLKLLRDNDYVVDACSETYFEVVDKALETEDAYELYRGLLRYGVITFENIPLEYRTEEMQAISRHTSLTKKGE